MCRFHDITIEHEGRLYSLRAEEGEELLCGSQYWAAEGAPSSWLAVAGFRHVRETFPYLEQKIHLLLAAGFMGITLEKLVSSIRWHEQYIRWHDGDDEYAVLEPGPEE